MPYMIKNIDIDFYFFTGKFVLLVNPSKIQDSKMIRQLRVEMMRLMSKTSYKDEVVNALDEKLIAKYEIEDDAATKVLDKMNVSSKEIDDKVDNIVQAKVNVINNANIDIPSGVLNKDTRVSLNEVIAKSNDDTTNIGTDIKNSISDSAAKQTEDEISNDEELIKKIYDEFEKSKPNATPISARDKAFRESLKEKQKEVLLNGKKITEFNKVRGKDIAIETTDVSNVTTSINTNMNDITFNNFEKTYNAQNL